MLMRGIKNFKKMEDTTIGTKHLSKRYNPINMRPAIKEKTSQNKVQRELVLFQDIKENH